MPTLATLLEDRFVASPEAPALLAPARHPCTFSDLWHQARRTAAALGGLGFDHSARVAVCVPNGPEAAAAALTVAACAVCAPLNPAYRASEFRFYLEDARADAVIVPQGDAGPIRGVAAESGLTSTHGMIWVISSPKLLSRVRTPMPPRCRLSCRCSCPTSPAGALASNVRAAITCIGTALSSGSRTAAEAAVTATEEDLRRVEARRG